MTSTQNLTEIVHPYLLLEGDPAIDYETLIWAILPTLIAGESEKASRRATETQEVVHQWLEKMMTAHPVPVSDTLSAFLSKRKWQSLTFFTPTAHLEPAVWRTLFHGYPAHVSKPVAAASDLAVLVTRKRADEVKSILTAALEELRTRVCAIPSSESSQRDKAAPP